MIVMFFTGTSVGAGVVISRYYGAHDDEKLHIAVETTMAVTFICGIIFTGLGIFVAPYMLKFMSTPDDVLPSASVYLKIYFSGVFGLLVYNMGSAILRAVGDTKRPLYFLCLSSVMNIGIDLLFVVARHGHRGGCLRDNHLPVCFRNSRAHRSHQKHGELPPEPGRTCGITKKSSGRSHVGLPTGFQQSLTSFSNVYVQILHQHLQVHCMAGGAATQRSTSLFPSDAAVSDRLHDLYESEPGSRESAPREKRNRCGSPAGTALTFASAGILFLFAPRLVAVFNQEPDVVRYGTMFLRMNVFMLAFCCPNQVVAGAMRGAGDSRTPMLIMLFSFVLFRQIYLYIATSICNTAAVVGFGYPVGWIVASVLVEIYYMSGKWEKKINM